MPVTYKKIASVTVGSGGTASIDFTNIPADYTDLILHLSARSSTPEEDTQVTLNTSGGTYTSRRLLGTGSAVATDSIYTKALLRLTASTDTASTFANGMLYIPNYTASTTKSLSGDSVSENNGTRAIQMIAAGGWSTTSAITSIGLTVTSANFAQYSTATLYGISKS